MPEAMDDSEAEPYTPVPLKQVVAVIKPFRAMEVLEAISQFDIEAVLVSEAKGYGRQKDQLPQYLGSEYDQVYLPKIEITIFVDEDQAGELVEKITEVARTGRIGDGKLMVFAVEGIEF